MKRVQTWDSSCDTDGRIIFGVKNVTRLMFVCVCVWGGCVYVCVFEFWLIFTIIYMVHTKNRNATPKYCLLRLAYAWHLVSESENIHIKWVRVSGGIINMWTLHSGPLALIGLIQHLVSCAGPHDKGFFWADTRKQSFPVSGGRYWKH